MHDYLSATHGNPTNPAAPVVVEPPSGRHTAHGTRHTGQHATAQLNWAAPIELTTFARRTLRSACEALGIPVGTGRQIADDGT